MFFILFTLSLILIISGVVILLKGTVLVGWVLIAGGALLFILSIVSYAYRKTNANKSSLFDCGDCGDIVDCDKIDCNPFD